MPDDEGLRERVRRLGDVLYGEACDERNTAASRAKRDAAERIWAALVADGTEPHPAHPQDDDGCSCPDYCARHDGPGQWM